MREKWVQSEPGFFILSQSLWLSFLYFTKIPYYICFNPAPFVAIFLHEWWFCIFHGFSTWAAPGVTPRIAWIRLICFPDMTRSWWLHEKKRNTRPKVYLVLSSLIESIQYHVSLRLCPSFGSLEQCVYCFCRFCMEGLSVFYILKHIVTCTCIGAFYVTSWYLGGLEHLRIYCKLSVTLHSTTVLLNHRTGFFPRSNCESLLRFMECKSLTYGPICETFIRVLLHIKLSFLM